MMLATKSEYTEQVGADMYSGDVWFESQLGSWLSWLRVFSLFRHNLGHNYLLQYPYLLNINDHLPALSHYMTSVLEPASLSGLRINTVSILNLTASNL